MCSCKKEHCHQCNSKKEMNCGVKKSNDSCHNHDFKDIVFKKEVCNISEFKALGIDKGMSGEEIITILVKLNYSLLNKLNQLKEEIAGAEIRRKTFYILNGGAKPLPTINGGLQLGDLLFENNTGDSTGVEPTIYEWNGVNWVLISDLKN